RQGPDRDGEVGRDEPGAVGLDLPSECLGALGGAERPDVINDVPALRFGETAIEGRHAAARDTVGDQPEELARVTARDGGRAQVGQRRRTDARAAVTAGAMLAVDRGAR